MVVYILEIPTQDKLFVSDFHKKIKNCKLFRG